jgi:hypothetical protein
VGETDKVDGMARLDRFVRAIEARYTPDANFDAAIAHEQAISPSLGGRTAFAGGYGRSDGDVRRQLRLFEL